MSDVPTNPTQGPGSEQPSEEEIRQYLNQLRTTPADQVLAEVSSALVNAAQVKLGRQDARLLLDVVAAITQAVRGRVSDELLSQLDDVLSKLRLAQVEAEKEVATAASQGHEEAGDLEGQDQPSPQTSDEAGGSSGGAGASAASRLWTPGG